MGILSDIQRITTSLALVVTATTMLAVEPTLQPLRSDTIPDIIMQAAMDLQREDSVRRDSVLRERENELQGIVQVQHAKMQSIQQYVQPSIIHDAQQDMEDIRAALTKPTYWDRELNGLVHFTQNYISSNWHKGGSSNFAALVQVKGFYNYKKERVSWENSLEWNVGVATTGTGDTLRKVNVTDDLFRLYSKFGYEMTKNFYISGSVDFNTTLFNAWESNKRKTKSAFMTPMKFYINAGVDYQPVKGLSIVAAPAVYRIVYAYFGGDSTRQVDVTAFGLRKGERLTHQFGSSIRATYKWQPRREISLFTDFYLYTNYRAVEIDWEITGDFAITRYFSTRLTLHPRYDSNYVASGDKKAKVQFKELLSIGFAHKFR